MIKRSFIFCIIVSCLTTAFAQTSPNGKIKVKFLSGDIEIRYNNAGTWQTIMSMPYDKESKMTHTCDGSVTEVDYNMLLGKKSHCTNAYKEVNVSIKKTQGTVIQCMLRLYNDGIAWKKSSPDDVVSFKSSKNNWLMKWTDSYEGFFPVNRNQEQGERYGYPALFEYEGGVFALLSESCMTKDNAGTSMYSTGDNTFSLKPDGNEEGGWQTLIIGSLADIVESTLITDNSEPDKLTTTCNNPSSTTWIQPGVASWVYWAYNHGSNDFNIIKKYVDMAAELKLPYVLIDAEWDEMPKLASNEGKTIVDAVKYATDRGIKPIIWYNSSVGWVNGAPGPKYRLNKLEDREKEFAWCESIGVKGVKIDFFSGDTNLNIKYMIELLECAAKHHLLVNFHGATIPRGWQRTYPNLVSTEGVYGEEWYNNVATFTDKAARHNATLPFTRNVVGSMDYTPCAFTDSQHPHITTNAHELALTVLFESGIQHLADRPESFLSQPQQVKDFLSGLPTAWDETKLLSGYPGENVIIARRKGTTWYIAGINGTDTTKTIDINTKRLNGIGGNITLFQDGKDSQQPWLISTPQTIPSEITLKPRGGFIITCK